MKISTRGRYALRVMIDLAEQQDAGFIRLKDISERQEISQKYLESIMTLLSKSGMVETAHGKGGGYKLSKAPKDYTVGDILLLTEGSLAPVACMDCVGPECPRKDTCRTLPFWKSLDKKITEFMQSVTLDDLTSHEEALWI